MLLVAIVFGSLLWRSMPSHRPPALAPGPEIVKLPVIFATRTFDPASPPADMPPMSPGELAVCDSNFSANASVAGESRRTDASNAIVTVTHVKVTLQLTITIWVPPDASEHVIEHEEGHRQISEYFYQSADTLAARIAATYIGRQVPITGADLNAESTRALQQMGAAITEEYDKQLNPEPAQLHFDSITDHSRNDVSAKDAVAQALKETPGAPVPPPANQ